MSILHRSSAEFIGTFWLVFAGCGSAIFSSSFPGTGIGYLGVALAFGLSLLTMGYTIGPISGCHINPAVSIGLWSSGRFPARELPFYIFSQLSGALLASGSLYLIASGKAGFDLSTSNLAANGYGDHSPGQYTLLSALITECLLSFLFLIIILRTTDESAPKGFAPIAIGLSLTVIHLVGIPITNLSVNPARSTGPALFVGGWAIAQLWVFWLAPMTGGFLAGKAYFLLTKDTEK